MLLPFSKLTSKRRASKRRTRRRLSDGWGVEQLEARTLLAALSLTTATPIDASDVVAAEISTPSELDVFKVTLPESGRLSVRTQSEAGGEFNSRTSLLGSDGQLLIQSQGVSTTNSDDLIEQHALAGTYFITVEGLDGASGAYRLTTEFDSALPPHQPLVTTVFQTFPFIRQPLFHAAGDFDGDGHLDIVTADTTARGVSLYLGLGDGAFQDARIIPVGARPVGISSGDFNGDGVPDLATSNSSSNDVSVVLGLGDGNFADAVTYPTGGKDPLGQITADLNRDGRLDLITTLKSSNEVSVLLGRGDGSFQEARTYGTGRQPAIPVVGDFNGDGTLDLATSNQGSNELSVLLGRGDGTFRNESRLATGGGPRGLVAADFNHDGHLDLANAHQNLDSLSIHWGRGDGSFFGQTRYIVGLNPSGLVSHDFNDDGHVDLASANAASSDVSILLNRGDGTFDDELRYRRVGVGFLVSGDVNGDSHTDLISSNERDHDVTVLLGLGDGTFQDDLAELRPALTWPQGIAVSDLNGDGYFDLATASFISSAVFVSLGRGDGTFQNRSRFEVASTPHAVVAEDFNGDGLLDLVTVNCRSRDVSVLLGRGDGTFDDQVVYPSSRGEFIELGDFNEDGRIDVLVGSPFTRGFGFLPGQGDGTLREVVFVDELESPSDGVTADFNGDGHLDLATTNSADHDVSFRLGRGDGTFEDPTFLPAGERPQNIVAGDFDGDGNLDLANTNFGLDNVSLRLGRGDGTFQDEVRLQTGQSPDFLLAGNLNNDGHLDLVVSNSGSTTISVLLGKGNGTFEDQVLYRVSDAPTPRRGLEARDFDGDGQLDLAISQVHVDNVAILLGVGDGQFADPLYDATGTSPVDLVTGEFNGDGRLDLAAVNPAMNQLAVSLGAGDASFESTKFLTVKTGPVAVSRGDFNRDGRLDLATANQSSHDVSVLFGLGTGEFGDEQRFAVGLNPVAVLTSDFNLDGRPDLATANATSNDISLLLGQSGGQFELQAALATGDLPQSLVTDDFNGDGRPDLAAANYRSQDLTVYLGNGDGTFQDPGQVELGTAPVALKTGDFDGDGQLDLATANYRSNDVSVVLGRGDGTFSDARRFAAGSSPQSLTIADFDGDGRLDIATANATSDDLAFLVGQGDGTFAPPVRRAVGDFPLALLADDFDGDGGLDLALAHQGFSEASILQGLGDLSFVPGGTIATRHRATPLVSDFNDDGLPDVALIGQEGKILLRLARPNATGVFEAPITVNRPSFAARDLAVVSTPDGLLLAALNVTTPSVSLYAGNEDGTFTRSGGPAVPRAVPRDLTAGDLNSDGRTDLVVAVGSNEVFVFLQDASGEFGPTPDHELNVGVSPSSVELVDVDGDQRLDIVVTNQSSGDVSVLLNEQDQPYAAELRYRASSGLYSLSEQNDAAAVRSAAKTAGLAAGDFDGDLHNDLVVTNGGSNSFAVLRGSGAGGFLNPTIAETSLTGNRPTVVVADRFNNDSHLDLAILNEGSEDLSILLGNGEGGFAPALQAGDAERIRLSAGNLPTGLSVHDVNGDGNRDLLLGNAFGDLLTLFGNGDGSFQPYQRADQNIAMAVLDLDGDGRPDFIYANEAMDRLSVEFSEPGETFERDRGDGLLAPGAVTSADLNRDGQPDLVVANSGANNVLVYLGTEQGQFGSAMSFSAGTSPTGITIQDLNDDQLPDLVVANEGSNDVNVLLGQGEGASWTLTNGPRLRAGAGPLSTSVQDATGDSIPDILVSNSQSDNVFLLPGLGGGFFDDQNPFTFDVGSGPVATVSLGSGFASINRGSNDLTFFPDFLSSTGLNFSSGGLRPVAGAAGDFNRDGLSDVMVANNGNGVISLLLGTADGLVHSQTFSHADVPRPTALAVSSLGDGAEVYIAGEGQESAILLTSFGVPVPGPTAWPLAPDIFLVSGPGLGSDVNLFTTSDEQEEQGPPVPYEGSTFLFASVGIENDEQQAEADEDLEQNDAHARRSLMMGVDEALRRTLSAGSVAQSYRAAVDEVARLGIDYVPSHDSPVLAAIHLVFHRIAYAASAPLGLPVMVAAIDQVLTEWTADDYLSVRQGIQQAAGALLEFLDEAWFEGGRPAAAPSVSAQEHQEPPSTEVSRAHEFSAGGGELRSTLFADPAFVTLCVVAVGHAGASCLATRRHRERERELLLT